MRLERQKKKRDAVCVCLHHHHHQAVFDADTVVTGLTTQGHGGGGGTVAAQWVTSFKLEYSTDGVTYTDIQTAGSDVVKASVLIRNSFSI